MSDLSFFIFQYEEDSYDNCVPLIRAEDFSDEVQGFKHYNYVSQSRGPIFFFFIFLFSKFVVFCIYISYFVVYKYG